MEWGVTGPFNALPTELLVIIFRELSNEDRGSCCQVCKRWREAIISEPSMWHKFEVTVPPGWNWKKTRSFFGHKGPRLYLHVRHLVLNLDRRAQGPQTVDAPQANAVLGSVSKLLRALPHDMTLTSFSCSGFKYYSASKDWKSRVICELCNFLRSQKKILEEVSFTSLELISKPSSGSLLRAVAATDEEAGESKIRLLSLTKMLHRTATPGRAFVKAMGRFSYLKHMEISFEHLTDEIMKTLVFACPLLRRLTILFDLRLQHYLPDQIPQQTLNEVVDKNPNLRFVYWLMLGDDICGCNMILSMFLIQLPVEGLVVDVCSLNIAPPAVNCYLDTMAKRNGNYLTFLEWSCVVRGSWCYGPALMNLVNQCPRLASISLKNIILDLKTATAISAFSSSAERGKIKLRVGGICVSGEASSNALEEGIRQLKDSLDLQVVIDLPSKANDHPLAGDILEHDLRELPLCRTNPAWNETAFPLIHCSIPGVSKKDSLDAVKKSCTMEYIHNNFPQDQWTHVFTDGSAEQAVKNGGAGIYIRYPGGREDRLSLATGLYSTNFKAEAVAIQTGATHVKNSPDTSNNVVVYCSLLGNCEENNTFLDFCTSHCVLSQTKTPELYCVSNKSFNKCVLIKFPRSHCIFQARR